MVEMLEKVETDILIQKTGEAQVVAGAGAGIGGNRRKRSEMLAGVLVMLEIMVKKLVI